MSGLFVDDAVSVVDLKGALGEADIQFISGTARIANFMATMDANEQDKAVKDAIVKNYAEFKEAATAAGDELHAAKHKTGELY